MQDPPPQGTPKDTTRGAARPAALVVLVALVAGQGIGLVGLAAFFLVEVIVATPTSAARAVMAALLTLLAGLGLLAVARGLRRARRWARAPALVTQLLAVPVAVGLLQGGRWYVGVPLLLWALVVLALLFTPAVAEVLEE
jgi:hypothetical protein